jgi:hypothetical protein
MIINYRDKYTDFKLFFLKKMLKIMHIFNQEINTKICLIIREPGCIKVCSKKGAKSYL